MTYKQLMKSCLGIDEMKDCKTLLRQLFAEFLGTFLYLCTSTNFGSNVSKNTVQIALANGLLLATIIQIVGHVSGGHINPAITVGVMIYGKIKFLRALCYVVVQVIGAVAGSYVSYALTRTTSRGDLWVTEPHEDLRTEQIFTLEFLMTFILVLVLLSAVDPYRGARGLGSVPLAVGLCVTACQCACFFYTGSMNPVRSLGSAVVTNKWDYHWVYWTGPMLGGVVAGGVYKFILSANNLDA